MGEVRKNALSEKTERSVFGAHASVFASKLRYEEPSVELVVFDSRSIELYETSPSIDIGDNGWFNN